MQKLPCEKCIVYQRRHLHVQPMTLHKVMKMSSKCTESLQERLMSSKYGAEKLKTSQIFLKKQ
jgi:hypothetical protein